MVKIPEEYGQVNQTGVKIPEEYGQVNQTGLKSLIYICAVSPDLLDYHLNYGDKIRIIKTLGMSECYSDVEWEVQDITNQRLRNTIDLCIPVGYIQGMWKTKIIIRKK